MGEALSHVLVCAGQRVTPVLPVLAAAPSCWVLAGTRQRGAVVLGSSWGHSAGDGGDLVGDSGVLAALPPPRKTRAELMKDIDAEYYGYRDEDDGILEPLEQEHEKKGM